VGGTPIGMFVVEARRSRSVVQRLRPAVERAALEGPGEAQMPAVLALSRRLMPILLDGGIFDQEHSRGVTPFVDGMVQSLKMRPPVRLSLARQVTARGLNQGSGALLGCAVGAYAVAGEIRQCLCRLVKRRQRIALLGGAGQMCDAAFKSP
jgi:hypothetical protein